MSDLSKRLDYLESLGYQFNGALWSDRITVHSPDHEALGSMSLSVGNRECERTLDLWGCPKVPV